MTGRATHPSASGVAVEVARESADRSPCISVIMSVCYKDREDEFREAIESLLAQTDTDFEIVIVADCTRPALWNCVEDYAARNPVIRVIPTVERLSLGEALNLAVQISRGEYLVHMDSDDISRPDRLAKIKAFFRANPDVDIVGSFIEEFISNSGTLGVIEYPLRHEEIRRRLLRRNPVAHASIAQRAKSVAKIGTYVPYSIRNEDTLYWLSALMSGARFANIPEPLYRVRYAHGNNRRRTGFRKAVSDLVDRMRIIIDLGGGWSDVLYALGVCIAQNCPARIYQAVRSAVVYRKPS